MKCALCGEPFTAEELDDPDKTYKEVTSWVTGAKSHSPKLRRKTGKQAHMSCVVRMVDGQSPDQDPIPGMSEE